MAKGVAESVPGRVVQGDFKGAAEEFVRHPLLAALDVSAAGAVAGRTAGGVARTVGKRGGGRLRQRAADFGSTVRPPLAMGSDCGCADRAAVLLQGLVRKGAQAGWDATRDPGSYGRMARQ